MRTRASLPAALGALALAACVAGCQRAGEEIVIGEYASMTGNTATFGQSSHNGVQMAIDEANAAGGLLGRKIRLIVEDDQSKPEEAKTAVLKLIKQDRVVAVLGEVASSRSLAGAPECQRAKVPMVSPASTNPKVTQIGDYIFRVCFMDPFQGSVMAKFARETLGLTRAAIFKDIKNEYSVGLAKFFAETFERLGGEIVVEESYSEGDIEFRAQLTKMRASEPETVFVPGYYTEVGLIARQARDLGIAVPLLGGDGWDSPRTLEIAGGALEGCFYSNHYSPDDPNPLVREFVRKYTERHKETPDAMAVLGYDGARILADAIRRAGSTEGSAIRDALAATKEFAGVSGTITIDEERNAKKAAVILRVEGDRIVFHSRVEP